MVDLCGGREVTRVPIATGSLLRCISPLLALRSYAENDAQRPLLEVKADSHVAVR